MMSANAVINNILVQSSDYIKDKHFEDLKMVLYMNLCNFTFVQNDTSNELIENSDIFSFLPPTYLTSAGCRSSGPIVDCQYLMDGRSLQSVLYGQYMVIADADT